MPYPPISALPATPSRNAPATFSALMDAFLAAFPTLRSEINALAAYLDTLALATGPGLFLDGSPANPSLSFAADLNTGFYRANTDQIGFATAGVLRAALSAAAFAISVPITGTAVTQSFIDTTGGRLLKVGDAGVLGAAPTWAGNANDIPIGTITASGEISETSAIANNWPTVPGASGATLRWFVLQCFGASTRTTQLATEIYGIGTTKGRTYRRTRQDSTWTSWSLVFDQATAVGTVSQSGGVPTGALIETGANANGRYVRFADGTQICWQTMAASSGAAATWTFPAAFSAAPVATGVAVATILSAVCLDAAPTTTAATFSARDKTDARRADTCHLYAIGRWF